MDLNSNTFSDGDRIPERCAFGVPDAKEHMAFGDNRNPHLRWTGAPNGTRSFALICVDEDVPADASDVNQEDKTLPVNMPRTDFYHWIMVDIPPELTQLAEGSCSEDVTARGKRNPDGPTGSRQGLNNYTQFLAGSEMEGEYFGYDGPCPPWNDERLHHYHFRVYALDVNRLDLPEKFDGEMAMTAIRPHILDSAELTGNYSLNPDVI